MKTLTNEEVQSRMPKRWQYDAESKTISREFECTNFVGAVEVIRRIVPAAEMLDHHPDILLHDYKKLKVMLSTHSAGGITDKDIILASQIDTLA